jgi:hypothetical protein
MSVHVLGLLFLLLQVSGDLVGGWTERVPMLRCTNPDGCLGASKGEPGMRKRMPM